MKRLTSAAAVTLAALTLTACGAAPEHRGTVGAGAAGQSVQADDATAGPSDPGATSAQTDAPTATPSDPDATSAPATPVDPATVIKRVTSIPPGAFEAAGVPADAAAGGSIPKRLQGGSVLKKGGKPRIVYVGALYCPFCGTHRWTMVAALSRFGTFQGLAQHRSGESRVPTFSFEHAKYTSPYVAFDAYETKSDTGEPLVPLPPDVEKAFQTFDAPPYEQGSGSIPWTYYGTHAQAGSPGPTQELAGLTGPDAWSTVSQEMTTGTGTFGKGIDAEANVMTAQICTLTGQKPANVCSSKAVTEAAKQLQR